jgi:DNA-binding transcriptional LysR family regulator
MFDEAEQRIKNDDFSGALRVGSSITVGGGLLPECIERMGKAFPNAVINVLIDTSKQIEEGILRNTLDIGVIEGIIHDKYIVSEPICEDSLCFICAPQHRFSGKAVVTPDEMLKEVLILREEGSAAREMFDIQLGSMGKKVTPSWQSVSNSAIISAVRRNLGISILPSMLVRGAVEEGSLSCFFVEGVRLSRKFKIIYHKNKFLSKVQTEFIRICREVAVGATDK